MMHPEAPIRPVPPASFLAKRRWATVIAPNFKFRLSGVTSSIVQIVPQQCKLGQNVATLGLGLPDYLPRLRLRDLFSLWRLPFDGAPRVWHARRNIEMLAGLVLRDVLRMPLKVLFTSAAQRRHTAYTRWLLRRMDAVVATSAASGAYLDVSHTVVPHGIDIARFSPGREAGRDHPATTWFIGCFGRVRPQKGTDLFVRSMIALLPNFPGWTAVVCGRVTSRHTAFAAGLKHAVDAAGLSERILFLGEVDDIRPWYSRLTLYVAPARSEGFGLTPLEAMASATAVVASDAGSHAQAVVTGRTGTLVPAGDGEALTRAIRPYLAAPEMAREHGRNGLFRVQAHFTLEQEARQLGVVYEAVRFGAESLSQMPIEAASPGLIGQTLQAAE